MDDGGLLGVHARPRWIEAVSAPTTSATASFRFADVLVTAESDDPRLFQELTRTFGPSVDASAANAAATAFSATIRSHHGPPGFGSMRLEVPTDDVLVPDDFLLGFTAGEPVFTPLPSDDPASTLVAFRGESEPLFVLRGRDCLFRRDPRWPTAVSLLLFHVLLRLRRDVLFFHAASLGIHGQGVLIVGRKGAGKSTTALALAARGHAFLGDETAGYVPETGEILPLRRPVGIKPGPRSAAVDRALEARGRSPEREGILRLDLASLLPLPPPAPVPLGAVLFLDGFAPAPRLERIEAGREELAWLQPSVACLVNAPPTRRVFEMARMLSRARVFRLSPGPPDETAAFLEEELERP